MSTVSHDAWRDIYQYAGKELPNPLLATLEHVAEEDLAKVLLWIVKNTREPGCKNYSLLWCPSDNYKSARMSEELSVIVNKLVDDMYCTTAYDGLLTIDLWWDPEQQVFILYGGGVNDLKVPMNEYMTLEYLNLVKYDNLTNASNVYIPCPEEM